MLLNKKQSSKMRAVVVVVVFASHFVLDTTREMGNTDPEKVPRKKEGSL